MLVLGAGLFLGLFGSDISALGSVTSSNALYNALWQFEADTPLAIGLRMEAGVAKLRRCSADQKRGSAGEVSRFQILPRIWRDYSHSRDYSDPNLAWTVAQKILDDRAQWYRQATGREPTTFDLYVMWNAPGHYEHVNFERKRVRRVISEKAERFTNLVESCSRESMITASVR
jgi:hypothetical protein